MKTIAVIPARGGSKRFPGKNVHIFDGLPLIVHSINYAKANSVFFEKIIVSTDSSEIMEIALQEGVEVIERPAHLSSDEATTVSALQHVVSSLNSETENVVLLQPTNPLRPSDLLAKAFEKFKLENYDSLMTVSRSFKKLGKIVNNHFVPYNYKMGQRSQDLDPLYFENGLLYFTKGELINQGKILGSKNYPFVVNHPYAEVDIDTIEDLEYATFLKNSRNGNQEIS